MSCRHGGRGRGSACAAAVACARSPIELATYVGTLATRAALASWWRSAAIRARRGRPGGARRRMPAGSPSP